MSSLNRIFHAIPEEQEEEMSKKELVLEQSTRLFHRQGLV